MSKRKSAFGFLAWLTICLLTGGLGAIASVEAAQFYAQLQQPNWAPPAQVFGPVWSTLYIMMAIAAWFVWRNGGVSKQAKGISLFCAQLAVNALWSWLFFAWHLGLAALINIAVLILLVVLTIGLFWRVNRWAGALLLPYLAWISFAAALNFSVWQLNPNLL